MSTLQQFIDDFLQGNGDDAINAALGHEFIPPPEPSPGPLMDPRAAAALSALAANGLSDEQSTLQGLLSCVPADQQGNPLDILLNLASLFERAGLMTQPRAVAPSVPSVPSVPALPPADDDARGASPARCALTTLPKEILRHVLSYRDLRTRFGCACASRLLRDAVGRLSLAPEHCLVQRAHPILATVCDLSALDAKTLGGLVMSQKDIFSAEPDRLGQVTTPTCGEPPLYPSTFLLRGDVFSLELTADGTDAPLFLATATLGIHFANDGNGFQLRFPGTDLSTSTTVRQLSAEGTDIRARILVSRRTAGGFQCAKLMDMVLNTVSSGATLRLFATSTIGYNEAVQDLHHARLIEVGCARLRLEYDTRTPHAGLKADVWSGPRRGHYTDGLERLMYREDIRRLLDRWVPWSRHIDIVPPPPGALAVRWSSFEHMRTYARNARAA